MNIWNMKKQLLLLVAATALVACTGTPRQGRLQEERRLLTGFERIEQMGAIDVKYRQADSCSVVVKAPEKMLRQVETRVEDGRLLLNMRGYGKLVNFARGEGDDVTVYVTSPDLIGIALRGSGDFDAKGPVDTDTLSIELRGSGDIDFADVICNEARVSLVGSGDVELEKLVARTTRIELVGSGDVKARLESSGPVEAMLTGSGDIKLAGHIESLRRQVRGSGSVNTKGLTINKH